MNSPAWRAANTRLNGHLAELIAGHRQSGLTFEQISRALLRGYRLDVPASTLAGWAQELVAA